MLYKIASWNTKSVFFLGQYGFLLQIKMEVNLKLPSKTYTHNQDKQLNQEIQGLQLLNLLYHTWLSRTLIPQQITIFVWSFQITMSELFGKSNSAIQINSTILHVIYQT